MTFEPLQHTHYNLATSADQWPQWKIFTTKSVTMEDNNVNSKYILYILYSLNCHNCVHQVDQYNTINRNVSKASLSLYLCKELFHFKYKFVLTSVFLALLFSRTKFRPQKFILVNLWNSQTNKNDCNFIGLLNSRIYGCPTNELHIVDIFLW